MDLLGYYIPLNIILIASGVLFGLIFIFTLIALIVALKANRKMKKLLDYNKGNDILGVVTNYYEKCHRIEEKFKDTQDRIEYLEKENGVCVKKVGALRYNAFTGNHANLSFAAAILDESDSGFVINGVYQRESTTTYLKEIKEGKSIFELSDEEKQAIMLAKENYAKKTNKI